MAQAFYAVARHDAMGYSPFSIESIEDAPNSAVAGAYRILDQLTPLILAHQGKGTMDGFLLDSVNQQVKSGWGITCSALNMNTAGPMLPESPVIHPGQEALSSCSSR